MALQDLTPQLRTRLSRMERAVGLFVLLAAALLACGFFYYIYTTAERKGWFKIKASYFTFTDRATGLKVGDPVQLMGFDVGQITKIDAQPPYDQYEVYVRFEIKEPYYDYLWTVGSLAKVKTADLLGKRVLEVTKGTAGHATYLFNPLTEIQTSEAQALPELENWRLGQDIYDQAGTNLILQAGWPLSTNVNTLTALGIQRVRVVDARKAQKKKTITALWNDQEGRYDPFYKTNFYWLKSNESPAVTDRLEALIDQVEKALPNILTLTNQLANMLSNGASLTSNLNVVATDVRPVVSHLAAATAQLDHAGALGEWLLPTNISHQLEGTLGSADATLTSVNTNLTALVENLGRSLDNLANLTSNLNGQVSANTNILSEVSRVVVNTDDLVQGLKRHWRLRSAFKTKTKPPGPAPPPPKEKSGK